MPRHGTLVLLAALFATDCTPRPAVPRGAAAREFSGPIDLDGSPLTLHFAMPAQPREGAPLVLYASGDGGWFGSAVAMFRSIAADGYPTVGFSTRAFLKIEQARAGPLTAARIAERYDAILGAARQALGLADDAAVVISGWSRGASLGVLAASLPDANRAIVGVVAIGLARDERLDLEPTDDDDPPDDTDRLAAHHGRAAAREVEMYPLIAHVTPRRCAVVQATNDRYLSAADARTLFGPDTDDTRFFAVEARNHRFSGGTEALDRALADAVAWAARRAS
jgi:hypothetical protein